MIKSKEKSLVATLSSIMENWRVGLNETLSSMVMKDSSVVDLGFRTCWVFLGFRHWNTRKVMYTVTMKRKHAMTATSAWRA